MLSNAQVPVVGFAAFSGTGKTTLLTQLLPRLRAAGLRVAVVKHAHHDFEIDREGKDSFELRRAGANQLLIASKHRQALLVEREADDVLTLDGLLFQLDQRGLDLILVEGFKREPYPKIELRRAALKAPYLYPQDPTVIALATDAEPTKDPGLPVLNLNDAQAVAQFIIDELIADKTP